ncbi:MAG TPA: ice-binding family protein [Polyangiaceae bacterium]|nr:ice-binding family protein [Polyangiaceae bacterium]
MITTLDTGDKPMGSVLNRRTRTIFAFLAPLATAGGVTTASALAVVGCGGTDTINEDAGTTIDAMEEAVEMDSISTPDAGEDISVTPDAESDADASTVSPDADASAPPDVRPDGLPDARVDVSLDATDGGLDADVSSDVQLDVLPDVRLDVPDARETSDTRDAPIFGDASPTAPPLGGAASFSVLGGSTVTNTGLSIVNGDLGVWPGLAVTGFPPGLVIGGTIDNGGPTSATAQGSLTTLYNTLMGMPCNTDMSSIDLSGKTLGPGVYCFSSSAAITTVGTLTLDGGGNPNAAWVFQIGSTLTTSDGSAVNVINGGSACNVFWQVGSSATIGKTNVFGGNIVAFADITVQTGSSVSGRALASTGAVTLDTNAVAFTTCGGFPGGDGGADVMDGDSSSDADSSGDADSGSADGSDASDVRDAADALDGG